VGWNTTIVSNSYVAAIAVANDRVYTGGLFTIDASHPDKGVIVLEAAGRIFHQPFDQD